MASDPSKRPIVTNKLELDEHRTLVIPAPGTFDTRFNADKLIYHPVPSTYREIEFPPVWRVVLKFGKKPKRVVAGLDIYGDAVFGRGSFEADSPDIELSNLDALKLGVSRIHALLRPGPNSLYLVDLKSTNGTFVNRIRLKPTMAQRIHNHDEIAFASLNCMIEVVSAPSQPVEAPPAEASVVEIHPMPMHSKPRTGTETIFGVKLEYPPNPNDPESEQ